MNRLSSLVYLPQGLMNIVPKIPQLFLVLPVSSNGSRYGVILGGAACNGWDLAPGIFYDWGLRYTLTPTCLRTLGE